MFDGQINIGRRHVLDGERLQSVTPNDLVLRAFGTLEDFPHCGSVKALLSAHFAKFAIVPAKDRPLLYPNQDVSFSGTEVILQTHDDKLPDTATVQTLGQQLLQHVTPHHHAVVVIDNTNNLAGEAVASNNSD